MKRIAIIPARGGSKRIKNKNIKDFNGKPMISYILNSCKESKLFEKIHVSTDSKIVKDIVEKDGLKIDFMRPAFLADDFTPLMPVYQYVLEKYKELNLDFAEVWVLMPCSPLIESSDLIKASKKFNSQEKSIKPLMAITEYPVPIEWALIKNKGSLYPRFKDKLNERSQDLPNSYYESGTFMIFPKEYVLDYQKKDSEKEYIGFELSKMKGIDIDNEYDWQLAEAVYLYNKK